MQPSTFSSYVDLKSKMATTSDLIEPKFNCTGMIMHCKIFLHYLLFSLHQFKMATTTNIVKSFYVASVINLLFSLLQSRWPPQQNIVKSVYVASVINLLFSLHQSRWPPQPRHSLLLKHSTSDLLWQYSFVKKNVEHNCLRFKIA
jgi:hypothetical protein